MSGAQLFRNVRSAICAAPLSHRLRLSLHAPHGVTVIVAGLVDVLGVVAVCCDKVAVIVTLVLCATGP